jgi:hypothetical protein
MCFSHLLRLRFSSAYVISKGEEIIPNGIQVRRKWVLPEKPSKIMSQKTTLKIINKF